MSNYPDGVAAFDIPGFDEPDEDLEIINEEEDEYLEWQRQKKERLYARIDEDFCK